jgi:histidine triad (HIT) family protein
MYTHAPEEYDCPFCRLVRGGDTSVSSQEDVIYRDAEVTAFMAAGWWPNNRGHVLVVPNDHYENIYDLPPELGTPIQRVSRDVALAFKATYGCDGVSTRQHNEPHGMQDVWHYHVHVFPRYRDDHLYLTRREPSTAEGRHPYAEKLRAYLGNLSASAV